MLKKIVLVVLSLCLTLVLSCAAQKNAPESFQPEKATIAKIQRKPLVDISINAFAEDTQSQAKGSGDNHLAMAWWIPNEYWLSILNKNKNLNENEKNNMLDIISKVSLLAVVQADVSPVGSFTYYSKESISKKMRISFTNDSGKVETITPMQSISSDLTLVLDIFKPIFEAAMGNLGKNLHFFVLNDRAGAGHRVIDPYKMGLIRIQLMKKNNDAMAAEIELPLNCLYVPRKCPNGKDAHITWKYCPWTGEKL